MKIKTRQDVLDYLSRINYLKKNYRIAVEALIFTPDGRLLLEKRGPEARDEIGKLEGVGGGLGEHADLLEKLRSEVYEELKIEASGIIIDRFLEIRQVQFDDRELGWQEWMVVSYLCRILRGDPQIGKEGKIESLHYLTLDELYQVPKDQLSNSTVIARTIYRSLYGNIPYYEVRS